MLVAMKAVLPAPGEALDDYQIFTDLAARLGAREAFTEGRSASEWLRHLYAESRTKALAMGLELPPFDDFWSNGEVRIAAAPKTVAMLGCFRAAPRRMH